MACPVYCAIFPESRIGQTTRSSPDIGRLRRIVGDTDGLWLARSVPDPGNKHVAVDVGGFGREVTQVRLGADVTHQSSSSFYFFLSIFMYHEDEATDHTINQKLGLRHLGTFRRNACLLCL